MIILKLTLRELGIENDMPRGCVTKCCTGERKSHKGYKWEFIKEG